MIRRFLSAVSLCLSLVYALPLAGFVLLRGVPATAPWWLDLANTFTLYLFILALPILLLALLSSSRLSILLSLIPVVLFVFLYGELFLPSLIKPPETAATLTVMTHNVAAANPNPERVAQLIADTNPDLVALQELTDDAAGTIGASLGDKYPYRALLPTPDVSGAGIFSRFPLESEESFTAGHLAQSVVVDVAGQKVHFFNFHPQPPKIRSLEGTSFRRYLIRSYDTERQTEQVAVVLKRVNEVEGPVVVAGDFNITDQSRQYGRITQNLTDVYREAGQGFGHTFPAENPYLRLAFPLIRIDYVFHSRDLIGLEARVSGNTGSDHLPVIAKLGLKNPS